MACRAFGLSFGILSCAALPCPIQLALALAPTPALALPLLGPSIRRSVAPSVCRSFGLSVVGPNPALALSLDPSIRRSVGPSVCLQTPLRGREGGTEGFGAVEAAAAARCVCGHRAPQSCQPRRGPAGLFGADHLAGPQLPAPAGVRADERPHLPPPLLPIKGLLGATYRPHEVSIGQVELEARGVQLSICARHQRLQIHQLDYLLAR